MSKHPAETPMQAKLRRLRPWPIGAVFIQRPGQSEADCRRHFRLMRELGFNALKQCQSCRGTDQRTLMHWALEEGIVPFWFGEAGWEDPTPQLLQTLGIDPSTPIETLRANRVWLDRQTALMRDRIDGIRRDDDVAEELLREDLEESPIPGAQPTFDANLTDSQTPLFLQWLKETYLDIDTLNRAWNLHHSMIAGPRGNTGEFADSGVWQSWEHLAGDLPAVVNKELREYRRIRDVLRCKADLHLQHVRRRAVEARRRDPLAPHRAGGEMGLFLPFASRATDMQGIANLMQEHGSFYPSIHFAWHFEEVDFETVRPLYMQSSIAADWMKDGWSASWEATGGPQQLTGYKAPFVAKVRDQTPGFTVDEGVMTQLMLSWIAGGFRGFGLWCWSARTAGWEAGEYALLDRNNRVTPRAIAAGKIGQACERHRDELWTARKQSLVGVYQDWDNEAMWAAVARGQRDHFKSEPVKARIGAARALINANVPWEHVTATELRRICPSPSTLGEGRVRVLSDPPEDVVMAERADDEFSPTAFLPPQRNPHPTLPRSTGRGMLPAVLYLPAVLSISPAMLEVLHAYAQAGGRVVLDAPGAWFDDFGQLLDTDDASPFEKLFGVRIADCQFSRSGNRPWTIGGQVVDGCTFDLQPTTARAVEHFDHGPVAATVNSVGQGSAVVLGWSASLNCFAPGRDWAEQRLMQHTLPPGTASPYACDGAIAYRLVSPTADHYFLLNDAGETQARLTVVDQAYAEARDAVTQERIDLSRPFAIPAHSGRWIRCERPR